MTPEQFYSTICAQNKQNQTTTTSPERAAAHLTQSLLNDAPHIIHTAEIIYTLCLNETYGAIIFDPHSISQYQQLKELHFCNTPYKEIKSIHFGKALISRISYLQINKTDSTRKRITALQHPQLLKPIYAELEKQISSR